MQCCVECIISMIDVSACCDQNRAYLIMASENVEKNKNNSKLLLLLLLLYWIFVTVWQRTAMV